MKYRTRMALYFCIIILMIAVGLGTINYWNSRQMVMQNARLRADDTLLQLKIQMTCCWKIWVSH